jgi:hypothetical protein
MIFHWQVEVSPCDGDATLARPALAVQFSAATQAVLAAKAAAKAAGKAITVCAAEDCERIARQAAADAKAAMEAAGFESPDSKWPLATSEGLPTRFSLAKAAARATALAAEAFLDVFLLRSERFPATAPDGRSTHGGFAAGRDKGLPYLRVFRRCGRPCRGGKPRAC